MVRCFLGRHATRAGDRGRLVAAFRKSAQALLTGPG